jgi:hypothetical protein
MGFAGPGPGGSSGSNGSDGFAGSGLGVELFLEAASAAEAEHLALAVSPILVDPLIFFLEQVFANNP